MRVELPTVVVTLWNASDLQPLARLRIKVPDVHGAHTGILDLRGAHHELSDVGLELPDVFVSASALSVDVVLGPWPTSQCSDPPALQWSIRFVPVDARVVMSAVGHLYSSDMRIASRHLDQCSALLHPVLALRVHYLLALRVYRVRMVQYMTVK